jgi:hypothetical protein
MARGIRVVLGLGLAGLLLVLVSGPLREPHWGRGGDRAYTRPDNRDAAAPKAVAGGEAGRQGPPAILSRLGGDPPNPGQSPGGTVKEAEGRSPRLSAQIASLVRHQNLAKLIE